MARGGFINARSVNPEAGDHAVSADPIEQAAAEAAIRASWREFPYYPKRYGERGWRFSLSDTGWIQTLSQLTADEARAQVRWLGGVLAARGMPLLLLERHLEHLSRALLERAPDRAGQYAWLADCAASLREMRLARIPEETFVSLAEAFEEQTRACAGAVSNMGVILVAAVADERAGVANAVASVESWACDPALFDTRWIEAVRDTLAAARR